MIETKNAKITATRLGTEDHGIMSFMLFLDYGGLCQGAGGYVLDTYDETKKKRVPTVLTGAIVDEVLRVVGVDSWEKLSGQYIRVKSDWDKVHSIGNLLKDVWLDFESFFSGFTGDHHEQV